jgi:excisionase family DNA binding protein
MTSEFLTVSEVAGCLRVTTTTVRLWIHRGYLPAVKVGLGPGQYRIADVDVGTFVRAYKPLTRAAL